MTFYAALAGIVLLLHTLWCAWVALGWMLTRGRRVLRWVHIGSVCWAIVVELIVGLPCPLTVAEEWLEARAGITPARGPFLVRLLDAIVYPHLPQGLIVAGAVVLCLGILGIYARRYFHGANRRTPHGADRERSRVGLCADCVHARRVESKRGSRYFLCELSASDSAFPKYPHLPVIHCGGYQKCAEAPR